MKVNNTLTHVIAFAIGAAAGSVVAWKLLEDRYAKLAQEEIESVKEVFERRLKFVKDTQFDPDPITDSAETPEPVDEEKEAYSDLLKDEGYNEEGGTELMKNGEPYVISPDEFGEIDDYETITLTWYADDILADDLDEEIEDVEGTVGKDSLAHFGEYEEDTVYVRNDRLECDYEIQRDYRRYGDVAGTSYPRYPLED